MCLCLETVKEGNLKMIKYLAEQGIDIRREDDYTLYMAGEDGNLKLVKYLIRYSDGKYNLKDFYNNYAEYCKKYKAIPINRLVIKYYLKGKEILDDEGMIVINDNDYESD